MFQNLAFTPSTSFSNTPCVGTSGIEPRNGTCYTEKECKQRNGVGVGELNTNCGDDADGGVEAC